jgi:hypothetical protein
MIILKINYKLSLMHCLRNNEHFDLFYVIVKHIQSVGIRPASLLPVWNLFLQAFMKENIIYKQTNKQTETKLIQEMHTKRKKSYIALKCLIEAASYDRNATIAEAASVLWKVIQNYSEAFYIPMTESSSLFVSLIQDLEKEIYADKFTLITGAKAAMENLKLYNENFMTIYKNRALAREEEKIRGTMRNARKVVDRRFAILADSINTFYLANELQTHRDSKVSEALSNIILFVNSYLGQHETILARRSGGRYSEDKTPSPRKATVAQVYKIADAQA